ncbi:MAG: hypothetical protein HY074_01430 [Deltaproteobacteria bacterium]|nr:hypothetical protein [Deltaproteobacteria bacterium]
MRFEKYSPRVKCEVKTSWDSKETAHYWIGYTDDNCPPEDKPQYCKSFAEHMPEQAYIGPEHKDFHSCDTEQTHAWVDTVKRPNEGPDFVMRHTPYTEDGPYQKEVRVAKMGMPIVNMKVVDKDVKFQATKLDAVSMNQAACVIGQQKEFEKLMRLPNMAAFLNSIPIKQVEFRVKDLQTSAQTKPDEKLFNLAFSIDGPVLKLNSIINADGACVGLQANEALAAKGGISYPSLFSQLTDLKKKRDFVMLHAVNKTLPAAEDKPGEAKDCRNSMEPVICQDQQSQLEAVSRILASSSESNPSLSPACRSFESLHEVPEKTICHTSAGNYARFQLVKRTKVGHEVWKDLKSGLLWSDSMEGVSDGHVALKTCGSIEFADFRGNLSSPAFFLPDVKEFAVAEANGFREVVRNAYFGTHWLMVASRAHEGYPTGSYTGSEVETELSNKSPAHFVVCVGR